MVNQYYQTGSEDEYIIRGNSAILKCKIPSFIADFVFVETWLDSDGNEYHYHEDESSGECALGSSRKNPDSLKSLILSTLP